MFANSEFFNWNSDKVQTRLADTATSFYTTDVSQRPKSRSYEFTRIEFLYNAGSNLPSIISRSDVDVISEIEHVYDGEFLESTIFNTYHCNKHQHYRLKINNLLFHCNNCEKNSHTWW